MQPIGRTRSAPRSMPDTDLVRKRAAAAETTLAAENNALFWATEGREGVRIPSLGESMPGRRDVTYFDEDASAKPAVAGSPLAWALQSDGALWTSKPSQPVARKIIQALYKPQQPIVAIGRAKSKALGVQALQNPHAQKALVGGLDQSPTHGLTA